MTEIVLTFAEKWGISPFDVLEKDIDDFFLIANSLINKIQKDKEHPPKAATKNNVKARKDDFWDF